MPLDPTAFGDKLSYSDYKDGNDFHPLAQATWLSSKEETPPENRRGDPARQQIPNLPSAHPSVPLSTDPKPKIPNPIWHPNKIGNPINDL